MTKSKIDHKIICSRSLKLLLCEVIVLMCTSNPQSMRADKVRLLVYIADAVVGESPNVKSKVELKSTVEKKILAPEAQGKRAGSPPINGTNTSTVVATQEC